MGASIMLIRTVYDYQGHELIISETLHEAEPTAVGCGPQGQQKAKVQ